MKTSSPADLAVAFRSLPRRLETSGEDAPATARSAAMSAVEAAISAAAGLVGSSASADAVAAAIIERRPEDWSDSDLTLLQSNADSAARAIRTLADADD